MCMHVSTCHDKMYLQGGQKTRPFLKCITAVYNDVGRHSIYHNVQLFIRSKTDILNVAVSGHI